MRDFRDAKAMAHTLRAALATKGINITVSQSLELIAQAFGVADWNTLSATICGEAAGPRNNAPASVSCHRDDAPGPRTCCLRFRSGVVTTPAKLASGWPARLYREGVEPSGSL
jgi:hypothetical protein